MATSQEVQQLVKGESEVIGQPVLRIDLPSKVTGKAVYAYDLRLPFMLYARVKRCPYPHAKILSINDSSAKQIVGVKAIVSGRDFPPQPNEVTPPLAREEVLYANQGVVAVASETPRIAELALAGISVEYEELPAVFDAEEAMSEKPRVIIRQSAGGNEPPNVGRHVKLLKGDPQNAFSKADFVIENTYTAQKESHFQLEPISFLARPDIDGGLTIWGSFSASHLSRLELANALRLDPSLVRVRIPFLGGSFGSKEETHIAAVCAALALKAGRPVKLVLSREEAMTATSGRHSAKIWVKDGIMKDGRIVAREIRAVYDGGAYGALGNFLLRNGLLAASAVYDIPNLKINVYRVYTNTIPGASKRAPIGTQMAWAIESHMDYTSSTIGMNPVEFRLKNVLHDGDVNAIGEVMESISHEACLLEVAKRVRATTPEIKVGESLGQPGLWREGTGFALAAKWSTGGLYQAMVRIRENGKVEVSADVVEVGQGTYTGIIQIAASEFAISPNDVILIPLLYGVEAASAGFAEGPTASRQLVNLGKAVIYACQDAKKRIAAQASGLLNAKPEEIEVKTGRVFVKSDPARFVKISDLFTEYRLGLNLATSFVKGNEFVGYGTSFKPSGQMDPETGRCVGGRISPYYISTAQAATVLVNVTTGQIRVSRIVAAADPGRAVNPVLVRGQIVGAVMMGVNSTLTEEFVFSKGHITNANLADYKLLTSMDAPLIEPIIIESWYKEGPYGAKGIGEAPIIPTAAAIRNAVHDAVGVWINDLPITSEKILRELEKKAAGG